MDTCRPAGFMMIAADPVFGPLELEDWAATEVAKTATTAEERILTEKQRLKLVRLGRKNAVATFGL